MRLAVAPNPTVVSACPAQLAGPSPRPSVIKEGTYVVLDFGQTKPGQANTTEIACVKNKGRVKVGKKWLDLGPLLGAPFGSAFTISTRGDLERETEVVVSRPADVVQQTAKNNAKLVDDGTAQTLGADDIAALKAEGKGAALVEALAAGSKSFASKTEFSQAKYLKKKAQKYMQRVVARRPTVRTVAECLFSQDPRKVCGIRVEALSLGLAQAGVAAGARVLVVDGAGGLLTGAVMDRLGGTGEVTACVVTRRSGALEHVKAFNHPHQSYCSLRSVMLGDLIAVHRRLARERAEGSAQEAGDPGPRKVGEKAIVRITESECERRLSQGFTSVIVAAPSLNAAELATRVLPMARPGTPFAFFNTSAQELGECLVRATGDRLATCMGLSETWFREHQVLPLRTHPHMTHSGTGGFVLHGQTVEAEAGPAPTAGAKRAREEPGGGGDGDGDGEAQAKKAKASE